MANFDISKELTKEFEGGFWNDPSAGWTYRGITAKFYPKWPGFARIRFLQSTLLKGKTIPRYYFFKDAALDKMVDDFYNSIFWTKKVNGNFIQSQGIANMCYDFILHKENAAVNVINNVAKVFKPYINIADTYLSKDVVDTMNANTKLFYPALRAARISYYNNSKSFSRGNKAAFVKRVNKLPETIGFLQYK